MGMTSVRDLIPSEAGIWHQPWDDLDFEVYIKKVDAKMLDFIASHSEVEYTTRKGRREIVKSRFSNERAARVYAKEIFTDFRNLVDDEGNKIENTEEFRTKLLLENDALLSRVIEVAHDITNYLQKQKMKEEKRFLEGGESSSISGSPRTGRTSGN